MEGGTANRPLPKAGPADHYFGTDNRPLEPFGMRTVVTLTGLPDATELPQTPNDTVQTESS